MLIVKHGKQTRLLPGLVIDSTQGSYAPCRGLGVIAASLWCLTIWAPLTEIAVFVGELQTLGTPERISLCADFVYFADASTG